jgi:hypothetical protein
VCGYTTLIYQMGNPFSVAVGETTRRPIAYSRRILHGPASELFLCFGSHAGRLLGGRRKKGRTECAYAPSTLDFFSPHPQGRRRGSPFARVGLCGFVCLSVGRTDERTVGRRRRRRWAHTRGTFPFVHWRDHLTHAVRLPVPRCCCCDSPFSFGSRPPI